jgi:hypothetical protein
LLYTCACTANKRCIYKKKSEAKQALIAHGENVIHAEKMRNQMELDYEYRRTVANFWKIIGSLVLRKYSVSRTLAAAAERKQPKTARTEEYVECVAERWMFPGRRTQCTLKARVRLAEDRATSQEVVRRCTKENVSRAVVPPRSGPSHL